MANSAADLLTSIRMPRASGRGFLGIDIGTYSVKIAQLRRIDGIVTLDGADRLRTCITPEGYLRLLPGMFHTDGFFIALLEKP